MSIDDRIRYLETFLYVKASGLDRENQNEINDINKLLQEYDNLLSMSTPRVIRDEKGNIKNFKNDFKILEHFKQSKLKTTNKQAFKKEFENLDMKSILKLIKGPDRG